VGTEVGIKSGVLLPSAQATAKAEIEADFGKLVLTLPNWIRNWLVGSIQFRSHRKVLLRMALAQHHSDNLLLGLKRLWN
jgi:hypothetical protein